MKNMFKIERIYKSIKAKVFLSALFIGISSLGFTVSAQSTPTGVTQASKSLTAEGLKLENKFLTAVKNHDVKFLNSNISSMFQGLTPAGVFTKKQLLEIVPKVKVTSYKINNFVASTRNDTLILSYSLTVVANRKTIVVGANVSTYKKSHNTWIMISHSYTGKP